MTNNLTINFIIYVFHYNIKFFLQLLFELLLKILKINFCVHVFYSFIFFRTFLIVQKRQNF